jgi:RNA polymerase sigma-70 factor (family 1)
MADTQNAELIRNLKSGNQHAFDTIFKKYYTFLCNEAKGYFRNTSLTEEIVCDIFTKLWQNRESLDSEVSLREYLRKAVHNNCINYYRMQKVQERLKLDVDENQKRAYSLVDIGQDPLEYTIMNEFEKRVDDAIELLPPRYKQAFKMSRFNNMTYQEIAVEMGISIDGVKMNMKKALESLREKLSDYLISIIILSISLVQVAFF